MQYLFSILLLTLATLSFGQNNTVSWKFSAEKVGTNEYTIHLDATVKDGWYVYSQYLESDDGPVRTSITFEGNSAIKPEGTPTEEGNKIKGYDNLFGMNITKYKKHLKISQTIKTEKATTLKGYVTFMTCNDEQCLPPTDVPFELELK